MEKSAAGKNINRMAVLVGINYPNTENQLRGCYNDVVLMRTVLVDRFGFDPDHIEFLTDDPDDGCSDHNNGGSGPLSSSSSSLMMMPTGEQIKRALDDMVDRAEEGDVLFFHYSGHGTIIPPTDPEDPASRPEEAIVPCDYNLITETDIRELVTRLPPGASLTILTDSCHSGGLIDNEEEQVGPNSTPPSSKGVINMVIVLPSLLRKTIPLDWILQKLKHLTRIDSGNIGDHLNARFKKQASLSFKRRDQEIVTDQEGGGGDDDRFDCDSRVPYSVILLSGCQANEESADVKVKGCGGGGESGDDGKSYGAFTLAVETALKKSSSAVGESTTSVSNRKVAMMARKLLEEMGINQHPCLYCSDESADAPFLWQPPD